MFVCCLCYTAYSEHSQCALYPQMEHLIIINQVRNQRLSVCMCVFSFGGNKLKLKALLSHNNVASMFIATEHHSIASNISWLQATMQWACNLNSISIEKGKRHKQKKKQYLSFQEKKPLQIFNRKMYEIASSARTPDIYIPFDSIRSFMRPFSFSLSFHFNFILFAFINVSFINFNRQCCFCSKVCWSLLNARHTQTHNHWHCDWRFHKCCFSVCITHVCAPKHN